MFLRNLLLFNFIFNLFVLRTLTDARALPAGSKSAFVAKALQKSHRHVLKVKRSQESFLQGSCQDPGIPVNGHRVVVELEPQNVLGKDYFPISAKVRFGCESSFLLRGSATLSCEQGDGRRPHWDSSAPQCVALVPAFQQAPDPCGPPPSPSPLAFTLSYEIGRIVTYQCLQDHAPLGGDAQLHCKNGTWLGQPLQCRRLASCVDHGSVANGLQFLTGTREGDVVAFRCVNGYSLLGARQLQCNSEGSWGGLSWPLCLKAVAQCGIPGLAAHMTRKVNGTREGGVAEYYCSFGYRLVGDASQTCLANGAWSGSLPACEEIRCGIPGDITSGSGTVSFSSTTFGSTATYECGPGFYLSGEGVATCGGVGLWSSPPPTCIAASCPQLAPPMFGSVNFTQEPNRYGSNAIFSCRHGFGMEGSPSRMCQVDGTWSGLTPSCMMGSCGSLPSPAHGNVSITHTRYGGYALFSCKEGFWLDGPSARVCQIFGEWSLFSPMCKPVECPELTAPSNGAVWPSDGSRYSSVAVYSCDSPGFFMFGGSAMRTCQANRRWTGTRPSCFGIYCPNLTPPHRGVVTYSSRVVGSEAIYSCEPGFELTFGDQVQTCLQDRNWSGTAPFCIQEEVRCGNLSVPPNGVLLYNDDRVGDSAEYRCDNSFQLLGDGTRSCLPDGMWSGEKPTCFVSCPPLPDPANGLVMHNGTELGSEACYSCDAGFFLIDCSPTSSSSMTTGCISCRICNDNGTWSGVVPKCSDTVLAPDCGGLNNPVNGSVDLTEGMRIGARANYSCDDGFELVGMPTRMCEEDGKWSGTPPTCDLLDCGLLLRPLNGEVEFGDRTRAGAVAKYSCNPGHALNGSSTRQCLTSGVWSGAEPSCTVRDCGELEGPSGGQVDLSNGTEVGSVALYSCSMGLALVGPPRTVQCLENGSWSAPPPFCEAIKCEELVAPANMVLMLTNSNLVNSTARYGCVNSSFNLVGPDTRVCTDMGIWTGLPPTCIEIQCPELATLVGGAVIVTERSVGSLAEYSCLAGFTLVGPDQRTCQTSGNWSETSPTCEETLCPLLQSPPGGLVSLGNRSVGSEAEYSCNEDFQLLGLPQRTCLQNGSWDGSEPTCIEIFCPALLPPANGTVNASDLAVGSTAEYTCGSGFEILGPEQRNCLQNGTWTGMEPMCMQVLCPDLVAPGNGEVNITSQTVGSTASYSCTSGFSLDGPGQRTCLQMGNWSGRDPTCHLVLCPVLTAPLNGSLNTTVRGVSSMVLYSCDEGFVLEGQDQRTCQENGSWTDVDPSCTPITCPTLSNPVGGTVDVRSNQSGGVAIYTCDSELTLVGGNSTRTCRADGTWGGMAPECRDLRCPVLLDPANGVIDVMGTTSGSSAVFSCMGGFGINGSRVLRCLDDGTWSPAPPTCIAVSSVTCPELPNPVDGLVNVGSRNLNNVATYGCASGFSLEGAGLRICLVSEMWSGVAPTCQPVPGTVSCPVLLPPEDGSVSLSSTVVGARATFACTPQGFVLEGSAERVCQEGGVWSGEQPTCGPVDCGPLLDPADGQVALPQGTLLDSLAFYSCTDGHLLVGVAIRSCQDNGAWSGAPPTCRLVDCQSLLAPVDGSVDTNGGTLLGQEASYSCDQGFRLVGVATRTCTATGEWSDAAPICEVVTCPTLQNPDNGIVVTSNGNMVSSIATYQCDPGFERILTVRFCMGNGEWSGTDPTCVMEQPAMMLRSKRSLHSLVPECPRPLPPPNGVVSVSEAGVVTTAVFDCQKGFVLDGRRVQTCRRGSWNDVPPTCRNQLQSCPNPGQPLNGRLVAPLGFEVGSKVYFIPRDGYKSATPGAALVSECGRNGIWSEPTPKFVDLGQPGKSCAGDSLDVFGRQCDCTGNGKPANCCRRRREWSSLSAEDKHRYISAVLLISSGHKFQSLYQVLVDKYRTSFLSLAQSTDVEASQYFHWHRYFLLEYEDLLRMVNRDITIPYWDWSADGHTSFSSHLFDPITGFGNSSNMSTHCVSSGPFQEGKFKISMLHPSSQNCLTREYKNFKFPVQLQEKLVSTDYETFHTYVQVMLGRNVRCFVGGAMCSENAASDPLLVLHLAGIDRLVDLWQERNKEDVQDPLSNVRRAHNVIVNTLGGNLTVANFSRNQDLAYSTCVRYSPLISSPVGLQLDLGTSGSGLSSLCLPERVAMESGVELAESTGTFISQVCPDLT